jgi:hypothetical protein
MKVDINIVIEPISVKVYYNGVECMQTLDSGHCIYKDGLNYYTLIEEVTYVILSETMETIKTEPWLCD